MWAKCEGIHNPDELFEKMIQRDAFLWTAMIAGYAQNGLLDEAFSLFNTMPERNVVSRNAFIAGCSQNGLLERAMEIFKQMQLAGVKPNSTTFANILLVCTKNG
ncbi:hypothetical protein KI387_020333, partial [Taxus chinensis]